MTTGGQDDLQLLFPTVVQVSQIEGAAELNAGLLRSIYAIKEKQPNTKPNSWSCSVVLGCFSLIAYMLLHYRVLGQYQ